MAGRRWIRLGVGLALLLALSPTLGFGAIKIHRIVAIGDLHGDFSAWRQIAAAANLIDADGRWSGGRTVLVQVGDVVDRGPQSLNIVQDLMRLQREAADAGGRVVALVGNHEAMNMTGDLRYVSPSDYAAFVTSDSERVRAEVYEANRSKIEDAYHKKNPAMGAEVIRRTWLASVPLGQIEHQRAWSPSGPIGRWVLGNPAVIRLDDSLFVHGGLSANYTRLSLAEINHDVHEALALGETAPDAIINDPKGPLWYRGLVISQTDPPAAPDDSAPASLAAPTDRTLSVDDELDQVLHAFKARRMVIGHTPILSGIAILHQGKLIRIDTGISAFYGGKLSYLEIVDGEPSAHETPRQGVSK